MIKVSNMFLWRLGAVILVAGFGSASALGTGFVYRFNDAFSGTAPSGPAPWVDASLNDTANGVLLTVDNGGLSGSEFLGSLYLNINPADTTEIPNLTFTFQNGTSGVTAPTIQTGEDAFKADGDGKYDILFNFATANSGRFGAGDSVTYLISGIPGLTSADFQFLSTPAGGNGPFDAAGHVQGIGASSDSGWIEPSGGPSPAPEPAPLAVMALAFGLLGARRWWLRRT